MQNVVLYAPQSLNPGQVWGAQLGFSWSVKTWFIESVSN